VTPAGTGLSAGVVSGKEFPKVLSEAGAFADLQSLTTADGLVAYDINAPFWSDGADKGRWMALPAGGKIRYSAEGEWGFPAGTTFVKHFARDGRRLETRVLVCDGRGGVSGAAYKWRADQSEADRVDEPISETVSEGRRWYFPGRADCAVCHTAVAGGVLGVKTRQMNRVERGGENQLARWARLGLFDREIEAVEGLARLCAVGDRSANVETRARSFLDANCAHCHRPGGVAGNFDARFDTPLAMQNLIGGRVLIDLGIDGARAIAPRDPWRSIVLNRVETTDQTRMPPLAHELVDRAGAAVLREWIGGMAGRAVVAPPTFEPRGGEFTKAARVTLRCAEPGAVIRYTLDGSLPGPTASAYERPIELTEPATVRARAYKDGMTRSVVAQETYVVP
jgi:uncharacterized repeat protein (TIGR03806 family)